MHLEKMRLYIGLYLCDIRNIRVHFANKIFYPFYISDSNQHCKSSCSDML